MVCYAYRDAGVRLAFAMDAVTSGFADSEEQLRATIEFATVHGGVDRATLTEAEELLRLKQRKRSDRVSEPTSPKGRTLSMTATQFRDKSNAAQTEQLSALELRALKQPPPVCRV